MAGDILSMLLDACRLGAASCCAYVLGNLFNGIGFPLVLTHILTGLALGPNALALIPDSGSLSSNLSAVHGIAIAFIGFVSAAEFVLKDIARPRKIAVTAVRILLVCLIIVTPLLLVSGIAGYPWLCDLSKSNLVVFSLLIAVMSTAPAASVVVAVISELKAAGEFCRSVMQSVIASSVLAIVAFSVTISICKAILQGEFAPIDLINLLVQLSLAIIVGFVIAVLLRLSFQPRDLLTRNQRLQRGSRFRIRTAVRVAVLTAMSLIPWFTNYFLSFIDLSSKGLELKLDIMLSTIIGGFIITNYTVKFNQFNQTLNVIKPYVFLVFFTMTGATLDVSVLAQSWSLLPLLFIVRFAALFVSFMLEWKSDFPAHVRATMWTGYIGQGGVIISLAAQLPNDLGKLGTTMSTIILSLLVVNTLLGPALFKWAVKRVKEDSKKNERFTMNLVGCGKKPLLFAKKLLVSGWNVHILDIDRDRLDRARTKNEEVFAEWMKKTSTGIVPLRWDVITHVSPTSLHSVGVNKTDSLVCALEDDNQNYNVVKAATALGLTKVLVHVSNPANASRFLDLQVLVMDMTSALLEFANIAASDSAKHEFAESPMMINDHLAQSIHAEDIISNNDSSIHSVDDSDIPSMLTRRIRPAVSETRRPLLPGSIPIPQSVLPVAATQSYRSFDEAVKSLKETDNDVRVFPVLRSQIGKHLTEIDWPFGVCVHAIVRRTKWRAPSHHLVLASNDIIVMTGRPDALAEYFNYCKHSHQRSHAEHDEDDGEAIHHGGQTTTTITAAVKTTTTNPSARDDSDDDSDGSSVKKPSVVPGKHHSSSDFLADNSDSDSSPEIHDDSDDNNKHDDSGSHGGDAVITI